MTKKQITNIDKQILIEKSNFISKNSTFFHNNLRDFEIFHTIKNMLLNPAPLFQCDGIQDLITEIKKSKTKNIDKLSYNYSFEVLYAIVNSVINDINLGESSRVNQIETLRLYVRYISTQTSGEIGYSTQNIITIDKEKVNSINERDKELKKQRRNR